MRDVSVLTIARGREAHLHNVIRGLAAQTVPPRELVIAARMSYTTGCPTCPFPSIKFRSPAPMGSFPSPPRAMQ